MRHLPLLIIAMKRDPSFIPVLLCAFVPFLLFLPSPSHTLRSLPQRRDEGGGEDLSRTHCLFLLGPFLPPSVRPRKPPRLRCRLFSPPLRRETPSGAVSSFVPSPSSSIPLSPPPSECVYPHQPVPLLPAGLKCRNGESYCRYCYFQIDFGLMN